MSVLPSIISAGNGPADGSLLGGADNPPVPSLSSNRTILFTRYCSNLYCGLSGPWVRTVRLLLKILGQKLCSFCVCSQVEWRMVRPWGADSLPVTSRFS